MVICGIGLAVLLAFAVVLVQSVAPSTGDFRQAQIGRANNPGNVMYDLRFFIASTRLGFLVSGAVAGGLLALNGVTLILLDRAMRGAERGSRQ
jgi:hypothetical protein